MSRIRLRQKQLLLAGSVGGAIILLVSVCIGFLYVNNLQKAHEKEKAVIQKELKKSQKQLNENKVTVTVAKTDLNAGDIVTEESIETVSILASAVPTDLVDTELLIGKFVKIDVQKNTVITQSMMYDEEVTPNDLRNQEFRLVELPTKLLKDDFVDVRIKFPTGQDYIVLSKKKVRDLNNGTVWYQMSEKEIMLMSSAIVDAYINDAFIYSLSYVEPYMQKKAIVTYPANIKVLDLIASNPNIIEIAKTEMEKRSREKLELDLKSMTDDERQRYLSGMTSEQASKENAYAESQNGIQGDTSNNALIDNQNNATVPVPNQQQSNANDKFTDSVDTVPITK